MLISESTHSLIEGLFVCENIGPQSLKGNSEPVGVYRVQGETDARSRFEAAASRGLLPVHHQEQTFLVVSPKVRSRPEGNIKDSWSGQGDRLAANGYFSIIRAARVFRHCDQYRDR